MNRGMVSVWRVSLFVLVVASIFWLGAVNIRAMIGNDMLKTGTLEFEDIIDPEAEREIFRLISFASVVIMISYAIVVISGTVFLLTSPFRLKENGWLMMSAILFYTFVPVEAFTLYLDGKMAYKEFFTTEGNDVFRQLFVARVGALAGAPVIALLCYYTIIALAVFRPFTKSPLHTDET
jgi:magnesium-transporting ATPase (P-type)